VTRGTLRPIRRHGVKLTEVSEALFQSGEPIGLEAVVVGKQDDHAAILAKKSRTDKRKGKPTMIGHHCKRPGAYSFLGHVSLPGAGDDSASEDLQWMLLTGWTNAC
jgi:hypothetical protein